MRINADFSEKVIVRDADNDWVASPMPGVERKMLDRIGEEIARATSIVRFAPDAAFSAHTHDGGEEFLVLEGVFSDEHGDFPAGSYIRNPPTSHHHPHTKEGCTILVKLHQFDPEDRTHVRIASQNLNGVPDANRPGVRVSPLFANTLEDVRIEDWAAGARVALDATSGAEVFIIKGGFLEGNEAFGPRDWLRLPAGSRLEAEAGTDGARVWVKSGHLATVG